MYQLKYYPSLPTLIYYALFKLTKKTLLYFCKIEIRFVILFTSCDLIPRLIYLWDCMKYVITVV